MSRLADLIAELCPDGVEYRRLDELFVTRNGYTPSRSDMSAWDSHDIPWFRMEDIRENGGILDSALTYVSSSAVKKGVLFPENSLLVATSATIGAHALITVPHLSNQRFTSLQLKDEYRKHFDYRFLYYYCFVLDAFCLDHVNVSSFPSVDMRAFRSFKFPFVPLAVQREIVRILDQFTTLEAELEAELEVRRAQYEHYRTHLLSYESLAARGQVRWCALGDVVRICNGRDYKTLSAGDVPVYGSGGVMTYVSDYLSVGPTVLIPRKGSLDNIYFVEGQFWTVDTIFYTEIGDALHPKFFFHYMKQMKLSRMNEAAGVPSMTQRKLSSIRIPIPSYEEQRRIADSLDRFDALVNDISSGLPAEIAARRAQYEHYRDRLLSFPEKVVSRSDAS